MRTQLQQSHPNTAIRRCYSHRGIPSTAKRVYARCDCGDWAARKCVNISDKMCKHFRRGPSQSAPKQVTKRKEYIKWRKPSDILHRLRGWNF
jgi:hypothetical protein